MKRAFHEDSNEGQTLPARLKATAKAARLTSDALGQILGVSGSTVRTWWGGRNEPSAALLADYSRAVGRSLAYLVTGDELHEGYIDGLREVLDLFMTGINLPSAMQEVAGEPLRMDERKQHALVERGQDLRDWLDTQGRQQWQLLSDEERLDIARRIYEYAAERRPKEGEGA